MLLVKNIAKIVGVDESGRLRVKGRDNECTRRDRQTPGCWPTAIVSLHTARWTRCRRWLPTRKSSMRREHAFPSFCDSHTHLVYAGSREQEFLDKINGLSYEEIAKRGGGILNSATACTNFRGRALRAGDGTYP